MEDNSHMRPVHAGCLYSACEPSSPARQQTTFTVSAFCLQTSSVQQRWAPSSRQPQLRKHLSTLEAAVPHEVIVTSFSLSDAGSSSNRTSSAKQPGSAKASAPSSRRSSRPDFTLSCVIDKKCGDSGILPVITVGSVFTLAEERWALLTHISCP